MSVRFLRPCSRCAPPRAAAAASIASRALVPGTGSPPIGCPPCALTNTPPAARAARTRAARTRTPRTALRIIMPSNKLARILQQAVRRFLRLTTCGPMRGTSYHPLMAKVVFGMSQSLDGYVDDAAGTLCMPAPRPALFRHFIDVVAGHAGAIYGRRIYEVMRYWDVDRPEWDVAEREFAAAWQRQPKWIASRTLA